MGNAAQALLIRITDCMVDFRPDDDGQIELPRIVESTRNFIMEPCNPELDKVLATAEWDESGEDYNSPRGGSGFGQRLCWSRRASEMLSIPQRG